MAVEILTRTFKYNSLILEDPDPNMLPEEVKDFYGNIYPELTQSVIEGPDLSENGMQYSFTRAVGTKGVTKQAEKDGEKESDFADSLMLMHNLSKVLSRRSQSGTPILPPSEFLEPV